MTEEREDNDKMRAGIDFIRRTGASQVQVRIFDEEYPHAWMAVAVYNGKNPAKIHGVECDAAMTATRAILRLCERVGDGGACVHCGKPTGFEPDGLWSMPIPDKICWYQFDPELKVYRRGCE